MAVQAGSPLEKKTIKQCDVRNQTGATVAGVMRHGRLFSNPSPLFEFELGDMVGVLGTTEQLAAFQKFAGLKI